MTPRRAITPALRARVHAAHGGKCHICGEIIEPGARWDVEHVVALADGGADTPENMQPAHNDCHRPKSAKEARVRAHVVRIAAAHIRHQNAMREKRRSPNAKQRAIMRAKAKFAEKYTTIAERQT